MGDIFDQVAAQGSGQGDPFATWQPPSVKAQKRQAAQQGGTDAFDRWQPPTSGQPQGQGQGDIFDQVAARQPAPTPPPAAPTIDPAYRQKYLQTGDRSIPALLADALSKVDSSQR